MNTIPTADVDKYRHAGINHSLQNIMILNELAVEKAKKLPSMMRYNISALKTKCELHQYNLYKYEFKEVIQAFVMKYKNEN